MFAKVPVKIRGIEYPSQMAAAKALGVHQTTIASHLERGTLEHAGQGMLKVWGVTVTCDGIDYPSISDFARAKNISIGYVRSAVSKARREGHKALKIKGFVIEWK